MEPMLAQDWFMPHLCISPSLFILSNEYNCHGIFYFFWGKLNLYWFMSNLQVQALIDISRQHYPNTQSLTTLSQGFNHQNHPREVFTVLDGCYNNKKYFSFFISII
jgi:hypothetical protein